MGKYVEDWMAFREEQYDSIDTSDASSEELWKEMGELIQGVRIALPEYRRVQESLRYQMTVEDLEDVELVYAQYANGRPEVIESDDLIDTVVQARCMYRTITDILGKAAEGIWRKPR